MNRNETLDQAADEKSEFRCALVADDVHSIRQLITSAMQKYGLTVLEAIDGFDAWTKLQNICVDVVITDIEMPRWTGIDLLKKMRSSDDTRLRELPVIVISSLHRPKLIDYVQRFNNAYFLAKPVTLRQIEIILGLIDTNRSRRMQRQNKN